MKYYKVTLSTKDNVTLNEDEFNLLIASPQQLVAIKNNKDNSIKVIINKAHIVIADFDHFVLDNNLLPAPEIPINSERIKKIKENAHKLFGKP